MNTLTTFDSTKESLLDLVRSIGEGKTQLPDFQRGWVWDDKHICDLLASISLAYPIGAVMMLQTGNSDVRFKPRLIEGVTLPNPPEPERLILDGQQRLTSLFQALFSGQPVLTRDARGKQIRRLYCIDIAKSLNPNADREEAIVSWPADRIVRDFRGNILADFSTPEREYEAGLFPLAQVFDSTAWRRGHNRYFRDTEERLDQFDRFEVEVMEIFKQYQIPLIVLRK